MGINQPPLGGYRMLKTNCTGQTAPASLPRASGLSQGETGDYRCDRRSSVAQPLRGHLLSRQMTLGAEATMDSLTTIGAGAAVH